MLKGIVGSSVLVLRSRQDLAGDRSGYCVGTDAAILAYYLRILNTKCTLLLLFSKNLSKHK